jgi:hypothetical protein
MFSIKTLVAWKTARGTGRENVVEDPPATPVLPPFARRSYLMGYYFTCCLEGI